LTSKFTELAIDCADPSVLARFWCSVLDYEVQGEDDGIVTIGSPMVPEGKNHRGPVPPIGTAAVRGGMGALLNSLHPRISYTDGTLALAFPCNRSIPLGQRRLALPPMIAGRDEGFVNFELDDVCYVGYPVRHPGPDPQTPQAAANGALGLVLGPLRAAALRALRQPLTVGELAAAVQCAPTTATYHLHQLAAAGLVSREQRGSSVLVSRTVRGDELVDLLAN
jgi:DNA-binding transcriptional ArsR family regulator